MIRGVYRQIVGPGLRRTGVPGGHSDNDGYQENECASSGTDKYSPPSHTRTTSPAIADPSPVCIPCDRWMLLRALIAKMMARRDANPKNQSSDSTNEAIAKPLVCDDLTYTCTAGGKVCVDDGDAANVGGGGGA